MNSQPGFRLQILLISGLGSPPGISALEFIKVPPGQVDFSNNTGARIECRAGGAATVTWVAPDLTPVSNITGLRRVYPDGTLVFSPFASEAFRQDVHAVSYRCQASSTAGTIVTADVKVRAGKCDVVLRGEICLM